MDLRPIYSPLAGLLFILTVLLEIPALFDFLVHDSEWEAFQLSAALTLFSGLTLYFVRDRDKTHFQIRHGYLFTVACWVVVPFFASLPFFFSTEQMSFADSVFETVSGLTTTGATVMSGLDDMPPGILLWRALIQWFGGIGIVVMAISIFPALKTGGMQLFQLESSDTSDKVFPHIREVAIAVFGIYAVLTLICGLIYYFEEMTAFEAVVHAMTTLSTGGFSTSDKSFAAFESMIVIWTGSVFMFLGSVPFSLMLISLHKKQWSIFFKDNQVRIYVAFVASVSILCAIFFRLEISDQSFFHALTLATFNVISVITTTGYAYEDYTLWGSFAPVLFFFLTFVGGCSGSTAGGIKFFRFHVLWLFMQKQLMRLIFHHGVYIQKINKVPLTNEISQSVLIYLFFLMMTFAVITIALGMVGLDFVTALSGAATAVSNVGPGLGTIIGPAGNFATLPDSAKWILDVGMILGRLEYVTLIVLLQPAFWRF